MQSLLPTMSPASLPPRVAARSWKMARGVTLALGTMVALASYRYLFGLPPTPPNIAANRFFHPWLPIHAAGAATALLIGAAQFNGAIRARKPQVHRITGRVYVLCCLPAAAAGLVLALGSSAGPVATMGFGLLSLFWFVVNVLGLERALSRRWAAHRAWMIRSWALTLSAVTLRLYLAIVAVSGLPFLTSYRAISFLCWVPNLLVAEWLLRRR